MKPGSFHIISNNFIYNKIIYNLTTQVKWAKTSKYTTELTLVVLYLL